MTVSESFNDLSSGVIAPTAPEMVVSIKVTSDDDLTSYVMYKPSQISCGYAVLARGIYRKDCDWRLPKCDSDCYRL